MSESRGLLRVEPATELTIVEFFGTRIPHTVKALMFYYNNQLVGIGGLKRDEGRWIAFSDIKKGAEVPPICIWRCAKLVMERLVKKHHTPVYTLIEKSNTNGRKWATKLGFKYCFDGNGEEEIFKWQS